MDRNERRNSGLVVQLLCHQLHRVYLFLVGQRGLVVRGLSLRVECRLYVSLFAQMQAGQCEQPGMLLIGDTYRADRYKESVSCSIWTGFTCEIEDDVLGPRKKL